MLSSWYPSREELFLGNFVKRHCSAVALKHHVWVIHPVGVNSRDKVGIEKKSTGNLTEIWVYFKRSFLSPVNLAKRQSSILKVIQDENLRFDLVHAHVLFPLAPMFAAISKKLNAKWVFSEHWSGWHPEFRPKISGLRWKFFLSSASEASIGFPVSQNLSESIGNELPEMPLFIVPNVVQQEFFQTRNTEDRNRNHLKFIHVSTLDEKYKNIDGTLQAFAGLKKSGVEFRFLIISDGDLTFAAQKVEEYGLSKEVEVRGAAPPSVIAEEMYSSDALVLFSNTENQPCVVLEALATGLPVIASSVGDIPNLVTNDKGLLVPPGDVAKLTDALIKFSRTRTSYDREKISSGANDIFSSEAVASLLSTYYEKLLGT